MPFNRINGFYVGNYLFQESKFMTLDDRNNEVNKSLESRFSQLNAALEAHEARLKSMMVPVDTWVKYHSYEDDEWHPDRSEGEHQFYIGMIKLKGAWRLCHAYHYSYYVGPKEDFDWKPLVEISIGDRLKAAEHIDKLRVAIVEAKEKLVPDIEKTIATLAESLEQ